MKIRPVVAELFRAVGQSDRNDEAVSGVSQCCETPLKERKVILLFVA